MALPRLRYAVTAAVTVALTAAGLNAAEARAGYAAPVQRLTWGDCPGIADSAMRCAEVSVPLDYARPHGRTITVMISRVPATDPERRRGVLLITNGGPGEPGIPLADAYRRYLDPSITARYDLIGFDQRFVERSTPIGCGQQTEEPGGWWWRDGGTQRIEEVAAQAARYARDCQRTAGWALPHATTANVARDIDRIRVALGEEKISYLGESFGAMVAAGYASMFPRHVDRFVLDSPPNPATYGRTLDLNRTPALQDAYGAFLDWVAAADTTYRLGSTRAEVDARLTGLIRRAGREPIVIDGHPWTADEVRWAVTSAVYFDVYWPYAAADLAAIEAGNSLPTPFAPRPSPLPGVSGVPADNHTAVSTAYRCAANPWPRDLGTYRRDLAGFAARYPTYGPMTAGLTPCAFWPVTGGTGRLAFGATTAPGALVLAARHDAAVPLEESAAVATALAGSRLVTIDRYTHVPFVIGAVNACLTGAVRDYLADGRLPTADLAC